MNRSVALADYPEPVVSVGEMTVPELAPLLCEAQARGHSAVAVTCEERAGRWSVNIHEGADVMVSVEHHGANRPTTADVMRLDEAWRIADSGLTIDKMSGPGSGEDVPTGVEFG